MKTLPDAKLALLLLVLFGAGVLFFALPGPSLSRTEASAGEVAPVFGAELVNFAHRGASEAAPENTFAAFDRAVVDGADVLELDVRLTADGEAVVIHDATVDRTTDGSGPVGAMSLAELRTLDAGYRFGGAAHPYRSAGLTVPTLAEVLARYPSLYLNVEIKDKGPRLAGRVAEVLAQADSERRVLVVSQDHATVRAFRKASGGRVATGASAREARYFCLLSQLGLSALARPEYEALQLPEEFQGRPVVTEKLLLAASRKGIRVDVWTLDSPQEMREALDLGVSGIITGNPRYLSELRDSGSA